MKLTKEERIVNNKELCEMYETCCDQIEELITYFEAFILYTERLMGNFNLKETHSYCKDLFQIYAVLMAEYDFRILYDSCKPCNNWRFQYHGESDDYLNFELLHNEISKKPMYKNPFNKQK
jgi:hypothetical protein